MNVGESPTDRAQMEIDYQNEAGKSQGNQRSG